MFPCRSKGCWLWKEAERMLIPPYSDRRKQPEATQGWKEYVPLALLLAFQIALHTIIRPTFGDDEGLVKEIHKAGLMQWLQMQHEMWTSRLLLEVVLALMLLLPAVIWKIMNIAMVVLSYCSLRSLMTTGVKLKEHIALALLVCCYPITHMCSAGWMTTTVIYLWPMALSLYAISGMKRSLQGEGIRWYQTLAYFAAALFGCNMEPCAGLVMAASIAGALHAYNTKRSFAYPVAGFMLAAAGILFALITPGNWVRLQQEIHKWMPEFPNLSFFDKMRIGIVSTFEHYVSVPNVLLFLLCLLVCVHVFIRRTDWMSRAVSLLPLLIQFVCSAAFFLDKVFVTKEFHYSVPTVLQRGVGDKAFQVLMMTAFIAMSAGLAISFRRIISNALERMMICLALACGLGTRLVLSFSPTVLSSGTRTYLFLYFALIAAIFLLWKKGVPRMLELCLWGSVGAGMAISLAYVYILQSRIP
jgi:hypothetical protein